MPYELFKDEIKSYSVDYNIFYNALMSNSYLRNIEKYIIENIMVLQKLEKNQICNKDDHFKYDFNFAGINFRVHFNIIKIIESVKNSNFRVKKLSSKNFSSMNSKVLYQKELYSEYHKKCKEPIIIVPFEFPPTTKYIVIDGNHRLSYQVDMNYKNISCYIYTPVNMSDFCFLYDFQLYKFYRDLNNFLIP